MAYRTEKMSWVDVDAAHRIVCGAIRLSDYRPDVIVGIARGGLIPATHISYIFNIKPMLTMYIGRQSGEGPDEHMVTPPRYVDLHTDLSSVRNKNVLVVDCALGTGETIEAAQNILREFLPKEVRIAITVDWLDCPRRPDSDFFIRNKIYLGVSLNAWQIFPWEV